VITDYAARFDQKHLALALAGAVVVLALGMTAGPIWLVNARYADRIEHAQLELTRLEESTAAVEALRPQLEELRRGHLKNGHYLTSGTEAVAAAELQRIVKRIAADNHCQVVSTQILPTHAVEGFVRVALKVRVRGDLAGTMGAMYDIEANGRCLFMDYVAIREGGRRRASGSSTDVQFDTEFELIGYMPVNNHES